MNLRGVCESGTLFAIPTYGFLVSVFVMLGVGFYNSLMGHAPVAESAGFGFAHTDPTGAALIILLLGAFASGCTTLTGVEAVSNGVPTFRTPKPRNASLTLLMMGGLSIAMMLGISEPGQLPASLLRPVAPQARGRAERTAALHHRIRPGVPLRALGPTGGTLARCTPCSARP